MGAMCRVARLGIVVVNYGSHALLDANLGPLTIDTARFAVVVVDSFLSAYERSMVREVAGAHGWVLVELPDNRGFAAGANAGAARAHALDCQAYLFLNPDAIVTLDVLEELRAQALRAPTSLISPVILDNNGRVVFRGAEMQLSSGHLRGLPADPESQTATTRSAGTEQWLTGACLAVSHAFFDRLNGFDERYFLYWEDVDLSHRALRSGGELIVRRDLTIVHDEGGTQAQRVGPAKSNIYYYYNCRNRLMFAARNLSWGDVARWLARTPAMSWQILLRGGRRQLLQSPRPLFAAVRGTARGVVAAAAALLVRRPADYRGTGARPVARRRFLVAHPARRCMGRTECCWNRWRPWPPPIGT